MAEKNILDFGARGDGETNDAKAIQSCIEACVSDGGGRVVIPACRTFLAGSFELRGGIEFHLQEGSRLLGSPRKEDYTMDALPSEKAHQEIEKRLWIRAFDAHDLSITGTGEINGNALAFATSEEAHIYRTLRWRPAMFCIEGSRNVKVRDVTLRNAANWCLHFSGCDGVDVERVRILNDLKFPNSDGIDPDHCKNVRIRDCHIEAGDDCIVLKNHEVFLKYGDTENVHVSGCRLVSTSAAIKIGTEGLSDFRNIRFENCVITASNRGLSLQIRDCGNVENVAFENISIDTRLFHNDWWGKSEPIYVTSYPRRKGGDVGKIKGISFRNIACKSENGIYLGGCSLSRPSDLSFENIAILISKRSKYAEGWHDRRPCEFEGVVTHPVAGLFADQLDGLKLRNVTVAWDGVADGFGPALECHDVSGLEKDGFVGKAADPSRFADEVIDATGFVNVA